MRIFNVTVFSALMSIIIKYSLQANCVYVVCMRFLHVHFIHNLLHVYVYCETIASLQMLLKSLCLPASLGSLIRTHTSSSTAPTTVNSIKQCWTTYGCEREMKTQHWVPVTSSHCQGVRQRGLLFVSSPPHWT